MFVPGPVTWGLEEVGLEAAVFPHDSDHSAPGLPFQAALVGLAEQGSRRRNKWEQTSPAQVLGGECGGILGSTLHLRLCSISPRAKLLCMRQSHFWGDIQHESWGCVIKGGSGTDGLTTAVPFIEHQFLFSFTLC